MFSTSMLSLRSRSSSWIQNFISYSVSSLMEITKKLFRTISETKTKHNERKAANEFLLMNAIAIEMTLSLYEKINIAIAISSFVWILFLADISASIHFDFCYAVMSHHLVNINFSSAWKRAKRSKWSRKNGKKYQPDEWFIIYGSLFLTRSLSFLRSIDLISNSINFFSVQYFLFVRSHFVYIRCFSFFPFFDEGKFEKSVAQLFPSDFFLFLFLPLFLIEKVATSEQYWSEKNSMLKCRKLQFSHFYFKFSFRFSKIKYSCFFISI